MRPIKKISEQVTKMKTKIYNYGEINQQINSKCKKIIQLDQKVKDHIKDLKQTASQNGICSLSSNQISHLFKIFVALPKGILVNNKWNQYSEQPNSYQAIINPLIIGYSRLQQYRYQQCSSLPGLRYKVKRPFTINFSWKNQNFEDKSQQISRFQARVWLHELDHLQGNLISQQQICKGQIQLTNQYNNLQNQEYLAKRKKYYKLLQEETPKLAEMTIKLDQDQQKSGNRKKSKNNSKSKIMKN